MWIKYKYIYIFIFIWYKIFLPIFERWRDRLDMRQTRLSFCIYIIAASHTMQFYSSVHKEKTEGREAPPFPPAFPAIDIQWAIIKVITACDYSLPGIFFVSPSPPLTCTTYKFFLLSRRRRTHIVKIILCIIITGSHRIKVIFNYNREESIYVLFNFF